MKTRNAIKILLVAAGGIYLLYRSWDNLERLADDWVNLFGIILIFGVLVLAITRVLRA
ncbi:hypothetical protein [Flavilitoribacter nigricans]|uniref:hypothetical protein n=1 Tax=Flavilitoribacter nigricans TaxID=70997 RepID=UPI001473618D|nr:hypothetical protein [Flavilitoribacter nigricans]